MSFRCKSTDLWLDTHITQYFAPWTDVFVENKIFPNYFETKFVETFETIGYWLQKFEIWFAIFSVLELIIDIIVIVMGTLEIHRITGNSVSLGKVLVTATYNFFMVRILNSVYAPAKPIESPIPAWSWNCRNLRSTSIHLARNNPIMPETLFPPSKELTHFCLLASFLN